MTSPARTLLLARRGLTGLEAALTLAEAGQRVRLLCRPRVQSPALLPGTGWIVDCRLAGLTLAQAQRRLPGLLGAGQPAALVWLDAEPQLLRFTAALAPDLPMQLAADAAVVAQIAEGDGTVDPMGRGSEAAAWQTQLCFAPGAATPPDWQRCWQPDSYGKRHWKALVTDVVEALRAGARVHLGGPDDEQQARWQARALQRAVGMAGLEEIAVCGACPLAALLAVLKVPNIDLGPGPSLLDLPLGRRRLRVVVGRTVLSPGQHGDQACASC